MALRFTRKRSARKVKRSPSKPKIRYKTRTITKIRRVKHNPAKRWHRRRIRRNPSGGRGRGMLGSLKTFAPTVLFVGGGFVVGVFATKYIPATVPTKARGAVVAILGAVAAGFSKSKRVQEIALGFAASGIFDLARQNIPAITLSEITALNELDAPIGGDNLDRLGEDSDDEILNGDEDAEILGAFEDEFD